MDELDKIAKSIRSLSIDAIEKANSGHPGLPLGAAELAAVLYAKILKHNPQNPEWIDRDRFVLSAGHGSMLLYAILHIAGYNIPLEAIKNFRCPDSICAGHPEYGLAPGVEATTGPLGQGIAMAVGMAVAEQMLAARYNTTEYKIFDHYTYALVGEGCLMEGVSNEASSFAGLHKLSKLIVFYDKNQITIDGSTDISFTDDLRKRYESYHWNVLEASMYNYREIENAVAAAKAQDKPTFIILDSLIGKGAPSVQGSSKAHGAPLGTEGVIAAKKNLGLDPEKYFFVEPAAYEYFKNKQAKFSEQEKNWNEIFSQYKKAYPEKYSELKNYYDGTISDSDLSEPAFPTYNEDESISSRKASGKVLNVLAKQFTQMIGGSADLEGSNCTKLEGEKYFSPQSPEARSIHFGIREFAMAAICNGILLHKPLRPFCATFLSFSDYMKPAIRLSALMRIPVIYVFTHDSIYVGEDGPTHQPIEMLAMLRAIPNCFVLRPCDAEETNEAWKFALKSKDAPACLILSRQNLPVLKKHDANWKQKFNRGAYVLYEPKEKAEMTILASGSELSLALDAISLAKNKKVQVISVPCKELLEEMTDAEIENLLGGKRSERRIITCEAGVRQGWEHWCKTKHDCFSIDRFGLSGAANEVAKKLHFTAKDLAKLIDEEV